MEFIKKNMFGLVAIVIAACALFGFKFFAQPQYGTAIDCQSVTCFTTVGILTSLQVDGTTIYNGLVSFFAGIKVGTNGTSLNAIVAGSCTIWTDSTTITATSTKQIVCQSATNGSIGAITGVTTDSICHLTMASSTNTTLGGLAVQGVSASSTAGTIVARLANFTGTTFTWTSAASSSSQWNYDCYDPL